MRPPIPPLSPVPVPGVAAAAGAAGSLGPIERLGTVHASASQTGAFQDRREHPRPADGHHASPHTVPFELEDKSCSRILSDLLEASPPEGMTVRAVIHALGERGLLMACMLFSLPSMLPIPIPGISVPQGLIITLIGLGVVLNRAPLLPERVLEYRLQYKTLKLILEKGVRLFRSIERISYPRMLRLTHGWVHALNGVLLVFGAIIMGLPLPIPFSNVLPAYGILLTAFGTLQRDGWMVVAGYGMYLLTVVYLGAIFVFGMSGVKHLIHGIMLLFQ